jgi:hypothetical protein
MDKGKAGKHLAMAIKAISKEVENTLDVNNKLNKEDFSKILNDNLKSMHDHLVEGEKWPITLTTLNLLVLLLANFSIFERVSFTEASTSNKLNKMSRKKVLKKAFQIMFDQADLMAREDEIIKPSDQ